MTQSTPPGTHPPTEVFKPARDHILAIALLTGIALLSISWAPQYLAWLLIIPALALWWVIKSRTRVSESGISVSYAFRANTSITWKDFAGIGFQRAHAFARTKDGRQFTLPGVTFNSLPRLAAASRGRIPDALTAGQEAADDKVVVIHRDGRQVLLNKDDYEQYRAEHPDVEGTEK
ncbi:MULTISPECIES: PH domain-containing protein [Corynebacterium]|uniref:PH domain-containing protein n=1 Tax=Corynebacterium TaxID=1716 RepID=UPI00257AEB7E|nr:MULTISPECIES: PH domain-containing protein [Corynebacterium]MDN6099419.1 PH domain-containing protein [Corynebacterium flavescens]MDN6198376.1 PH domain-containing protein [Corynebacterium flavescens]MDN6225480.1 PH domain-containing protein [Corynebacterium flavescens]MDN6430731.1 PH domain-containing protein [Corynebacterium flavescens]MDN6460792.1 PH domain-containing protein [Corynebacterium flavescens]